MKKNQKTQSQLITTSAGNRYMATYAGSFAGADYFKCSRVGDSEIVGTVASLDGKNFGPLCNGYLTAVQRARNVIEAKGSWFAQLFVHQK